MARPSARPKLIQAALTVVAERGVAALTLDAVAEEAGMTKRGLLYHFPSRHELLIGIHEDLAARIERELVAATGGEPETASLLERTRGYVQVAIRTPSKVEMQLIMEAAHEADVIAPWLRIYRRWFPEDAQPITERDTLSLRCLVARMAADGSWGYESMLSEPMSQTERERLLTEILRLVDDTADPR